MEKEDKDKESGRCLTIIYGRCYAPKMTITIFFLQCDFNILPRERGGLCLLLKWDKFCDCSD
jgi:hypothetical protein